jgi:hypothetical protein
MDPYPPSSLRQLEDMRGVDNILADTADGAPPSVCHCCIPEDVAELLDETQS